MDKDTIIENAFEQHYNAIFRYCLSNLEGDEQAAMDAVDTVFMIVKGKADSLDTIRDMKRWLFTIAKNTVKNIRKKQKRYRRRFILFDTRNVNSDSIIEGTQIPWWEKHVFSSWTFEEIGFDDAEMTDEEIERLKVMFLQTLSDEERTLFCSHYDEGISTRELAERYGKSQAAIRMRLSRISMKLMEKIRIYFRDERSN